MVTRNTFSVVENVNPSERSAAGLEIRYLRLEISKCDKRTQQQGSVVLLNVPPTCCNGNGKVKIPSELIVIYNVLSTLPSVDTLCASKAIVQ